MVGKLKYLEETFPRTTLPTKNGTWPDLGLSQGCGGKLVTAWTRYGPTLWWRTPVLLYCFSCILKTNHPTQTESLYVLFVDNTNVVALEPYKSHPIEISNHIFAAIAINFIIEFVVMIYSSYKRKLSLSWQLLRQENHVNTYLRNVTYCTATCQWVLINSNNICDWQKCFKYTQRSIRLKYKTETWSLQT